MRKLVSTGVGTGIKGLIYDKPGLTALMKPYVVECLEFLWDSEGQSSGKVWGHTTVLAKARGEKPISRASVIFELNALVRDGVLQYTTGTGKGGHHRIYSPKLNREAFEQYIVDRTIGKLAEIFGDGPTLEALANLGSSVTVNQSD